MWGLTELCTRPNQHYQPFLCISFQILLCTDNSVYMHLCLSIYTSNLFFAHLTITTWFLRKWNICKHVSFVLLFQVFLMCFTIILEHLCAAFLVPVPVCSHDQSTGMALLSILLLMCKCFLKGRTQCSHQQEHYFIISLPAKTAIVKNCVFSEVISYLLKNTHKYT